MSGMLERIHDPGSLLPTHVGGRPSTLWLGEVVTLNPDRTVDVRATQSRYVAARVTPPTWYAPVIGDRVTMAFLNGDRRVPLLLTPTAKRDGSPVNAGVDGAFAFFLGG